MMRGGRILHVHVVQKGDTLWKISRQYGVSFDEVKRLNAHLANPDYIVPGMKIFVPEKSAKMKEIKDHPYANGRSVKNKEGYVTQPVPKSMPKPVPQPVPQPIPQPMPHPTMHPIHIHMPQQKQPQPIMQMPPQVFQQPINQHLTMTQMVPPYMGVPYGWVPVPDMDVHHPQVLPIPPQPAPKPALKPILKPTPTPMPTSKPENIPAPKLPQGWQLDDSSSLGDVESSLQVPQMPPQYQQPPSPCGPPPPEYYQQQQQHHHHHHQQPSPPPPPCGPPPPEYFHHHQRPPCGCGQPNYAQPASGYMPNQGPSPDVMQESNEMMQHPNMMPQPNNMSHPNMMPPHMMPYMRCTPCQMLPAPQGQWGYPAPVRYY